MQNYKLKRITYYKKSKLYKLSLILYPTQDIMDSQYFTNIKKVRCIPITEKHEICLVSYRKSFRWMVPGGTIEKGENAITALKREILEEANLEIKDYELIGFIKFQKENRANKKQEHTEIWFIASVAKILKQKKDPSAGYALHRNFFTPNTFISEIQNWGDISKYFLAKIKNRIKN